MMIFLKGMIIGLSIAAPVGPIGVLCIQRTLISGRASGIFSGLGAASADAVYGAIAAFGLSAISDLLVANQFSIRLIGGAFLAFLGVKVALARTGDGGKIEASSGLARAFISVFGLTLTNPMTILAFAAIFSGLGLVEGHAVNNSSVLLVVGVFSGSALWWVALGMGVALFRKKMTHRILTGINRAAGAVIFLFGIVIAGKSLLR